LLLESRRLGFLRKTGGKFLPNLNMTQRPIAEKYCEGKLKRISKEKLKVHETALREQISGIIIELILLRTVYCLMEERKSKAKCVRGRRVGDLVEEYLLFGNKHYQISAVTALRKKK
jgi:hypothetical protein